MIFSSVSSCRGSTSSSEGIADNERAGMVESVSVVETREKRREEGDVRSEELNVGREEKDREGRQTTRLKDKRQRRKGEEANVEWMKMKMKMKRMSSAVCRGRSVR